MSESAGHELIIVRRDEDHEHEHHSSAWKVAHADFMTAMMAFFLIMWLVSVTDDEVRKGIAQYFNPIKLSEGHTDLKGLSKPGESPAKDGQKKSGHADQASDAFNPLKMSQGASDHTELDPSAQKQSGAAAGEAEVDTPDEGAVAEPSPSDGGAAATAETGDDNAGDDGVSGSDEEMAGGENGVAAEAATGREAGAFSDPYATLDAIATEYVATHPQVSDAIAADQRPVGATGGKIDRDPFDPLYWQTAATADARSETQGDPRTMADLAEIAALDAVAPDGSGSATAVTTAHASDDAAEDGQASPSGLDAVARAETVAADLEGHLRDAASSETPLVSVKATPEGLLISLTDDSAFSMFEIGSAVPNGATIVLMSEVGQALAGLPGNVVIRGHTDGRPFRTTSAYDNWQLSTSRAQMAYYMLVRGGLDGQRVVAIEGQAERRLLNAVNPLAAENRRIEILVEAPQ